MLCRKPLLTVEGKQGLSGISLNLAVVVSVASVLSFGVVVTTRIAITATVKALEVVGVLLIRTVLGISAVVAVTGIIGVVYMTVEARTTVIIGACADESAANEPLWSVVAVGCATVGAIAVITVGTRRANSNADGDLGLRFGWSCAKATEQRSDEKDVLDSAHEIPHVV